MTAALPYLQAAVGVGLVAYAAFLLAQRFWGSVVRSRKPRAPVDDLRLVIDLAARLRDAGQNEAVAVCQKLLDELLKPVGGKP